MKPANLKTLPIKSVGDLVTVIDSPETKKKSANSPWKGKKLSDEHRRNISIGGIRAKRYIDLTGQRFGMLTVIKLIGQGVDRRTNKHVLWLCKCDCGLEKEVDSSELRFNHKNNCGCKRVTNSLGSSSEKNLFHGYRCDANKKKRRFELSWEGFLSIIRQNCWYCGSLPKPPRKTVNYKSDFRYNGIDRLDSKFGYVVGNVVPCCSYCNWMKSDLSVEEFREHISKIVNYIPGER